MTINFTQKGKTFLFQYPENKAEVWHFLRKIIYCLDSARKLSNEKLHQIFAMTSSLKGKFNLKTPKFL